MRYLGSIANVVGGAIAVLDVELVKNANWSIYDAAAGTNAKVYRCAGDETFYVLVSDNQTNYFIVAVWEAWDVGTHTGSGSSTSDVAFSKYYNSYSIFLNDNRFVWVNVEGIYAFGYYCGLIKRLDTDALLVLVYGGVGATYYKTYNALAGFDDGTYNRLRLLEDVDGTGNVAAHPLGGAGGEGTHFVQDFENRLRIRETPIYYPSANPRYLAGFLDGIVCLRETAVGWPIQSGDIFTVDGEDWQAFSTGAAGGEARFFVRMND